MSAVYITHTVCGAAGQLSGLRHPEGGYECSWCNAPITEAEARAVVTAELARRAKEQADGASAAKERLGVR